MRHPCESHLLAWRGGDHRYPPDTLGKANVLAGLYVVIEVVVNISAKVNIPDTAPIVAVLNAMRENFGNTIAGRARLIAAEASLGGIIAIGCG